MGIIQETQAQIASLQTILNNLLSYPQDTFNIGTVALISSHQNTRKSYYLKIAEESWKRLNSTDHQGKELIYWILKYADETNEYFEVYIMQPGAQPIYARP